MNTQKTLYRVEEDKIFSGVCAGLAEYLNMDVGLVRVLFVLAFVFSGFLPIIVVYIVMAAILPRKEDAMFKKSNNHKDNYAKEDDYTINEDDYRY